MEELDAIDEEVLAREVREEALWSLHRAAAMPASHLTSVGPDGALPPSSVSRQPPQPRYPNHHSCEECGETFLTIRTLTKHHEFHDPDRPFWCPVCSKRFLSSSNCSNHLNMHSSVRFACEFCNITLSSKSNLRRHMTIHTKEQMYRCQECGVLFCQEHEYDPEKLRPPSATTTVFSAISGVPITQTPVKLLAKHQLPLTIDVPSSCNVMTRMERILIEKRKKKLKKKQSLIDACRNIAALPLPPTAKRGHKHDSTLYHNNEQLCDYRRREAATVDHREAHSMQRVAYDMEVVL